jgi:hypothetical protein
MAEIPALRVRAGTGSSEAQLQVRRHGSISQWFPLFEHVLDAVLGLSLAAQAQKCLALKVEEKLLRDALRRCKFSAARKDFCKLSADDHVVIRDVFRAAHQVQAELHFGEGGLAEDPNVLARLAGPVAEFHQVKRQLFGIGDLAVVVHAVGVAFGKIAELARFLGAC